MLSDAPPIQGNTMSAYEQVNILLVDDQPDKLLTYEAILHALGEHLLKAGSAREALEQLLKTDIAVILMDVRMPEIDGFELAKMIRDHPRYQLTAIIFISAVHRTDFDQLQGYAHGVTESGELAPELLRYGIEFADGRRATSLDILTRRGEDPLLRVDRRG